MGDCFQWRATGQCSKGDSCSFSRGQRAQSSSPAPKVQTQTDGRKPCKGNIPRGKSPPGLKGKSACRNFFKGKCTEPSCDYWHPPVCQNYKSESGCKYGDYCQFRHTEAGGQPSKKSKKRGGKGAADLLKETFQLGCVSQDYPQKKFILWEVGKLGSNQTVIFSKGTWHHVNILERKGPSQGVMQKCEPQERIPWAPNLRKERKTKP